MSPRENKKKLHQRRGELKRVASIQAISLGDFPGENTKFGHMKILGRCPKPAESHGAILSIFFSDPSKNEDLLEMSDSGLPSVQKPK